MRASAAVFAAIASFSRFVNVFVWSSLCTPWVSSSVTRFCKTAMVLLACSAAFSKSLIRASAAALLAVRVRISSSAFNCFNSESAMRLFMALMDSLLLLHCACNAWISASAASLAVLRVLLFVESTDNSAVAFVSADSREATALAEAICESAYCFFCDSTCLRMSSTFAVSVDIEMESRFCCSSSSAMCFFNVAIISSCCLVCNWYLSTSFACALLARALEFVNSINWRCKSTNSSLAFLSLSSKYSILCFQEAASSMFDCSCDKSLSRSDWLVVAVTLAEAISSS